MVKHPDHNKHAGFTLIELVVVIVIVGILSVLGGQFIVAPITGYIDLSRRAKLVDQAEMAMRRMQRDIRAALPNSIDVTTTSVTMINTVDGGRYRRYPTADGSGDVLNFSNPDVSFEVLGGLGEDPEGTYFKDRFIVVYNVSPAYPPELSIINECKSVDELVICDFESIKFEQPSPYQRFFIVDKKITYRCENDKLVRYEASAASTVDGEPSTVTKNVLTSDCEFSYSPGTTQRAGLVTLKLTLDEAEEKITLLHQVHVVNAP